MSPPIRSIPADFAKVAPGTPIKALCSHYKAGHSTIVRWLQKSGIRPMRSRHKVPHDLATRAQTMSGTELARHYGFSPTAMRKMLKREGVKQAEYTGNALIPVPDDLAARCAGMTKAELVAHYGRSDWTINRWLDETGLTAKEYVRPRAKPRAPVYNRPKLRYVRQPGHSNVATVKRNVTAEDMAADVLRRYGPVYRCDEKGLAAQYGKLWRLGNIIIDGDELIARAARKVAA